MAKQNMNSDIQSLHEHQINSTWVHFAMLQKASTEIISPPACCHRQCPPSTQDQNGSLKICPKLAGAGPCLSLLQGSFTTASFIQFSDIKRRSPGPENPSVEASILCGYTGLCDKHDSQGKEIRSLIFSQLVEIPWSPKPNFLIKHCKPNASSHRSSYAWNNRRGAFQQPKDKCLFSCLCRPVYANPPEESDLWVQQSPSITRTGLKVVWVSAQEVARLSGREVIVLCCRKYSSLSRKSCREVWEQSAGKECKSPGYWSGLPSASLPVQMVSRGCSALTSTELLKLCSLLSPSLSLTHLYYWLRPTAGILAVWYQCYKPSNFKIKKHQVNPFLCKTV